MGIWSKLFGKPVTAKELKVHLLRIERDRLVEWAGLAIGTPSFTGDEHAMAELMRETFLDLGLQVQWQYVLKGVIIIVAVLFQRRASGGSG